MKKIALYKCRNWYNMFPAEWNDFFLNMFACLLTII